MYFSKNRIILIEIAFFLFRESIILSRAVGNTALNYKDFLDWKTLQTKTFTNNLRKEDGSTIKLRDVRLIMFEKEDPNYTHVSTSSFRNEMSKIAIKKETRTSVNQNITIGKAYNARLPIATEKYQGLKNLCTKNVIPIEYQHQYLTLPTKPTVPHCLMETDEEDEVNKMTWLGCMGIIHTPRRNIVEELVKKMLILKEELIARYEGIRRVLTANEIEEVQGHGIIHTPRRNIVEELVKKMLILKEELIARCEGMRRALTANEIEELVHYSESAMIRCSIYNIIKEHFNPHPHKLVVEYGRGEIEDPLHLRVAPVEGFFARQGSFFSIKKMFGGIGIIHTPRRNIVEELVKKMLILKEELIARSEGMRRALTANEIEEVQGHRIIHTPRRNVVKELVKKMLILKEEIIARCEGMRRTLTAYEIEEVWGHGDHKYSQKKYCGEIGQENVNTKRRINCQMFGGMRIIHTPRRNIVEELVKKMLILKEELIARCEGMRRALTANKIEEVRGMGIIHTPRRNIVEELVKKMLILKEELIARCEGMRRALTANEIEEIDKETDESNDVDDDTALQDMNPDSEEPQKTNDIQEPDETEEHHEIQKPHGTQQSHETHELRVTQEPNESQQTPKTRIRVSNKERKPPQMTHSIPNKKRAVEKLDAAFEILTKASNKEPPQDPSECQIFGNLVAKKLSKYSNVAQTAVQEAIMNILFAADKGYYNQYPAPRGYQSNNYSTIQSELVQRDSVYQDTQLIQSPYSPRPAAHWDFATDASSQAPQFSPVPLPLISPASASSQCSGMTNYSASTSNPPPFTSATLLTDLNLPDN
ncbi:unnamed protein product [Ceutorhynchus assimilis]|uniref:Uncharacterized protein n=1 Tax=Ceutorhynchus assimilis TaxID=467358 RepID=A0A9N9N165_9CUCU|nr:unnamed protein product [Ceutorhynchus assimilis]